jgi:glycosyltransferase involved in cell wall biosynthesis
MASDASFESHVLGTRRHGCGDAYEHERVSESRSILGPRLVLHGTVPASEVFSVLDSCLVIASPSLEEMSGNQVTEGIMRGCHAVVFADTGVAGIVRKVGNGTLVPHGNEERFVAAVLHALSNPPSRAMIESARKNVAELMSPAKVAGKHLQLYNRVLAAWGETV